MSVREIVHFFSRNNSTSYEGLMTSDEIAINKHVPI
jgi:hypothetical protein